MISKSKNMLKGRTLHSLFSDLENAFYSIIFILETHLVKILFQSHIFNYNKPFMYFMLYLRLRFKKKLLFFLFRAKNNNIVYKLYSCLALQEYPSSCNVRSSRCCMCARQRCSASNLLFFAAAIKARPVSNCL